MLRKASYHQVRTQSELKREKFNSKAGLVSYLDQQAVNMGRQQLVESLMSKWNAKQGNANQKQSR